MLNNHLASAIVLFLLVVLTGSCNSIDTADLKPVLYTLNIIVEPQEGGSVSSHENSYLEGATVVLQASANPEWIFSEWSGTVNSSDNPITITINQNMTITAKFEYVGYPLTIQVEGEGVVEDKVLTEKTNYYDGRANVELSAVASEGWQFAHWKGDLTGSENPEIIEMIGPKEVTAVFTRMPFRLSIEKDGEGQVDIDLLSGELTDDGYLYESQVELSAIASEGWEFAGWKGDETSEENPLIVEILGETKITAQFQRQGYTLTIETLGEGSVEQQIIVQPKSTNYLFESVVELTALPVTGWEFFEWQGELTGSINPQQIEMDGNKEVTAIFNRRPFSLGIEIWGEGNVNKTLISGEVTEEGYLFETIVELEAIADEHWKFVGWEGDILSDENPVNFEILQNSSITAVFESVSYQVAIQTEGEGSVLVDVISGSSVGDGFNFGTELKLTANPANGWTFAGWSGAEESVLNPVTIEVTGDLSITAHFTPEFYSLNVIIDGNGEVNKQLLSGETNVDGNYIYQSEVELSAIPDDGWLFSGWSGDIGGNTNPLCLVLESDKNVTALFDPISISYDVYLSFEDNRGTFDMQFGQSPNPDPLRRLAPPPPPAGALNAYFRYNNTNYVRDYRKDTEIDVTWELRYQGGAGSDLTLSWNLNSSDINGSLTLEDQDETFEIDMFEENTVKLPDGEDGVLLIRFTFIN